jgi:hypothetical protein
MRDRMTIIFLIYCILLVYDQKSDLILFYEHVKYRLILKRAVQTIVFSLLRTELTQPAMCTTIYVNKEKNVGRKEEYL